jgi:ATP-dependent RNA helicase DeaD
MVAGLMRDHLGERPGDPAQLAAEARRAKNPPAERRAPPPEPRAPRSERERRPHASFATWEPPVERDDSAPILPGVTVHDEGSPTPPPRQRGTRSDDEEVEEGFAQIYVNVGRRDGVKPGDFVRLLEGLGHLERGDTGRIRIRDRNTFVSVKKEQLERAVAALAGQTIAGRAVTAEPAKKGTKTGSERDVRT